MSYPMNQPMHRCDRFRLLPPQTGAEPLDVGPEALVEALLLDPPLVTGNWRVRHEQEWLPLAEHPKQPWLDELLRRAIVALRAADPNRCEYLCRRLLGLARPANQEIAVRHAHLLLAYLEAAGGQWPQAARRLGTLVTAPDDFGACVENNLAYAQCILGQPRLACRHWLTAVRACPECVPAWLSLHNFADVMLAEGARDDRELPSWRSLRQQATDGLKKIPLSEVTRWLNATATFPGCESVLVFPVREYSPPLSSYLPTDDTGEAAGRRLLAEATAALTAGRVGLAEALAVRAMSESPKLAASAQQICSEAIRRRTEAERLDQAARFQRLLDRFERELAEMISENMDSPEATLQLMAVLMPDAATLESCRSRYKLRMVELCWDAAERTEGAEREEWLRRAGAASVRS